MFVYHMPDSMIELQSTFERLFREERTYVNISHVLDGTAEQLIPSHQKDLTYVASLFCYCSEKASVTVGPTVSTRLSWAGAADAQEVRGRGGEDAYRIRVERHGEPHGALSAPV